MVTKSKSIFVLVGNAVTDNYYYNFGTILYWWTHSMISIMKTCDFKAGKSSEQCDKAVSYALDYEFGDIDSYNICMPFCKPKNDFVGIRKCTAQENSSTSKSFEIQSMY